MHSKITIRPQIKSALVHSEMSIQEQFQNQTLRPIIKLQHDLLITIFKHFFTKNKNKFFELPSEKRKEYLDTIVLKNVNFQQQLKGMIIGFFTVEEYEVYLNDFSELNKRMMTMIKERVLNTL